MINWSEIQNARGMFEPRRELKKRLNEPQHSYESAHCELRRPVIRRLRALGRCSRLKCATAALR